MSLTGKITLPCPRSRLTMHSLEMGSAVPSRVSLLISILRLNLVLTYYGIPPDFHCGVRFLFQLPYVCSVRESRTITLKVRRRASAGHSRVQRGESGLRRRACVSPELLPLRCGGGPRQGTRGCRGVSRDCGDAACVSPELLP